MGDDRRKQPYSGDGICFSADQEDAPFNFRRPFETWVKSDEYYTPASALDPLLPYLPRGTVVWEGAWGKGHLARWLRRAEFEVIGKPNKDFLYWQPDDWNMLVTNPPYSLKDDFLERAYSLGKPFAFLMPIDVLGAGKRNALYREHGIELLIPSQRVNYILPENSAHACNFHSAWFCWKLDLPQQLTFIETDWNGRTTS